MPLGSSDRWEDWPFAETFCACLGLGLFFCWVTFSYGLGDGPWRLLVGGSGPYGLSVKLATGVAFLALATRSRVLLNDRACLVACAASSLLSVGLCWCATLLGSFVLIIAGVCTGGALALYLCLWLGLYRRSAGILVMLLLACWMGGFFRTGVSALGDWAVYIAMVVLPLLAIGLFGRVARWWVRGESAGGPVGDTRFDDPVGTGDDGLPWGLSRYLFAAALLLCNFASGPVSYGAIQDGLGGGMTPLLCLLFAVALLVFGIPGQEALLALFALVVCACMVPLLIPGNVPASLKGFASAGFWAFNMFSIAWFALEGRGGERTLPASTLVGLAIVYLLTGVAELVGMALPSSAANIIALVSVGVALAIALINATQAPGKTQTQVSGNGNALRDMPESGADAALDALACDAGLTEGERGVLVWLSKGYALKQVAVELGITEGTAKYHRHNIYQKLGVASRQELINLVEDMSRREG